MLHDLKKALIAAKTGQGSYGPNYDGNKLAASIESLIKLVSGHIEEVHQFKRKDATIWSTESYEFLTALAASEDGANHDFRTMYTSPAEVFTKQDARMDTRAVGNNLDNVPQPYAGAIVLLETIAQCGATSHDGMGNPTPNRELCLRFASELRAEGQARAQDTTKAVYQD
jgi:hypothetical protein